MKGCRSCPRNDLAFRSFFVELPNLGTHMARPLRQVGACQHLHRRQIMLATSKAREWIPRPPEGPSPIDNWKLVDACENRTDAIE
jgi:hypothetical protein